MEVKEKKSDGDRDTGKEKHIEHFRKVKKVTERTRQKER